MKSLLNRSDVQYVVNACDAGREGELIFKRIYDLSESKVPVKRLWINSMEDSAIKEGLGRLSANKEVVKMQERRNVKQNNKMKSKGGQELD